MKSGLRHMSVFAVGDMVMFLMLLTFNQAVRVVAIAMFLKQLWCLIVSLRSRVGL